MESVLLRRLRVLPTLRAFSSSVLSSQKQGSSFHKRPLPSNLIALSSQEGKRLFRETLDAGFLENYFPLSEQFITQSEPSYCSLSSLAMVLNALKFDPKKVWKGSWRWVSEEMLYCESKSVCGHSEEKIKKEGLSFDEFESLARCHGVKIQSFRACHSTAEECGNRKFLEFYDHVERITSNPISDQFLVANFSRKQLGQTGDGHYSPIAALHKATGHVLVLDVARFKYPPYWVKIEDLWNAMAIEDNASGQSRGYFLVSGWDESIGVEINSMTVTEVSNNASHSIAVTTSELIRTSSGHVANTRSTVSCSHHDHQAQKKVEQSTLIG